MKTYNEDQQYVIINALQCLCEELTERYRRINWGGCGVVAGIMGKSLQRLGIEVEIVTAFSVMINNAAEVRQNVRNRNSAYEWDKNGLNRSHCAVRFKLGGKMWCWDSDKLTEGGRTFGNDGWYIYHDFGKGLTPVEIAGMGRDAIHWNPDFDRTQIKGIRDRIKTAIRELERGLPMY